MIGRNTMSPSRLAEWERACAAGVMLPPLRTPFSLDRDTLPVGAKGTRGTGPRMRVAPASRKATGPDAGSIPAASTSTRGPLPSGARVEGEPNSIGGTIPPSTVPINIDSATLIVDAKARTDARAAEIAAQKRGRDV